MNTMETWTPNIGIILERARKEKMRKAEFPREPNTVEKLNKIEWLTQSFVQKDQALVWRARGGSQFKVKFGEDTRIIDEITYFGLEHVFKLSDGTLINQDEAHLFVVS